MVPKDFAYGRRPKEEAEYDYVVTGAAGFIGGHLTRRLSTLGPSSILALDRRKADYDSPNAVFEQGELYRAHVPVKSGGVVFHLAANPSVPDCEENPRGAINDNVNITKKMADAAKRAGARLVFVSSVAAILPLTVYGMTKRAAEEIVLDSGGVVVRLPNVYGPGGHGVVNKFCEDAVNRLVIGIHQGEEGSAFEFVHVIDVVETLTAAAGYARGSKIVVRASACSVEKLATSVKSLVPGCASWLISPPLHKTPPTNISRCDWPAVSASVGLDDGLRAQIHYERKKAGKDAESP